MVSPREVDRVRALELALPGLGLLRRLRQDVRQSVGAVVGYLDETGNSVAWTGDEEAPYFKHIPETPRVVNLIPHDAAAIPILRALGTAGRCVEVWAIDLRDPALNPPKLYLQIFDQVAEPTAGAVPSVTAVPLCQVAAYEWAYNALLVGQGLWVALSTTALTYTPLVANQEFSITARVLP